MAQPPQEIRDIAERVASLARGGVTPDEALARWEHQHGPISGAMGTQVLYWAQRLIDVRRAAAGLEPGQPLSAALEGVPAPGARVDVPVLVKIVLTDPETGEDVSRWRTVYVSAGWEETAGSVLEQAEAEIAEHEDRYGEPEGYKAYLAKGFLFAGGHGSRQ